MAALLLLLLAPVPPDRTLNENYLLWYWTYTHYDREGRLLFYEDGTLEGYEKSEGGIGNIWGRWHFDRGQLYLIMRLHYDPEAPERYIWFCFRATKTKVYSGTEFQIWEHSLWREKDVTMRFKRQVPK